VTVAAHDVETVAVVLTASYDVWSVVTVTSVGALKVYTVRVEMLVTVEAGTPGL